MKSGRTTLDTNVGREEVQVLGLAASMMIITIGMMTATKTMKRIIGHDTIIITTIMIEMRIIIEMMTGIIITMTVIETTIETTTMRDTEWNECRYADSFEARCWRRLCSTTESTDTLPICDI